MSSIRALQAAETTAAGIIVAEILAPPFDWAWRLDDAANVNEPVVFDARKPEKTLDPEVERIAMALGFTYIATLVLMKNLGPQHVSFLAAREIDGTPKEQAEARAELHGEPAPEEEKDDDEYTPLLLAGSVSSAAGWSAFVLIPKLVAPVPRMQNSGIGQLRNLNAVIDDLPFQPVVMPSPAALQPELV